MKGNKLKTKLLGLIIAFGIAIVLSAIISTILLLIFTRVPEQILRMTPSSIITSISSSKEHMEMFVLVVVAFMLVVLLTVFKVFDLKDYKSNTYKVTNNIEIPVPIGDKQTQQGSAWWMSKKELKKNFGVNRIDPLKKEITELLKVASEDKKYIKENKPNNNKYNVNSIFQSGGLVIGKKDRRIVRVKIKKVGKYIRLPIITSRKVEDIYYIKDDLHSLTVGATRSGKTRNLVLQTIINTGLAGENMIISDPKRRAF